MKPAAPGQIDLFDGSTNEPEPEPLVDASARSAIASVLDRNVVVLAGAGAGKTHELVGRMVATIETGSGTVEKLAAITFTRKAAGELRNRFARRLTARVNELGEASTVDRSGGTAAQRLAAALDNVDQCFIGTIHAFCARLLRERPLEAGLSPDFVELDEREEMIAQREAWEAFITHVFAGDDPVLSRFMETGLAVEDLFPFFQTRVQYAEVALKGADTNRPEFGPAAELCVEFVRSVEPKLTEHPDPDTAAKTVRRAVAFLNNRGLSSDLDEAEFVLLIHRSLSRKSVTLNRWPGKDGFARKLRDDVIPALIQAIDPIVNQWNEYVYTLAAPLVDEALEFYRQFRRDRAQVTFQDLMEITVDLLKRRPSARRHFQTRLTTIFVDEFQDTDPLQAEMLLLLTGENVDEKDWRQCVPRPGSLFIVGDEKQSIYRFRRADIDIFRRVVDIIQSNGGLVVELTTSFRSLGNLCGQINRIYESVFATADPRYQASYAPLSPVHVDGADQFCARRLVVESDGKVEDRAEAEAGRIADFIHAAIAGATEFNGESDDSVLPGTVSPGSFMLIARQRRRLGVFAEALERRGIPYDLTGGDSLGALTDLRVLIEFLEVLLYPDDSVKYFSYLRGPLVGLSDPELYGYKAAGGRFYLAGKMNADGLDPVLQRKIEAARDMLAMAADDLRQFSGGAAIERIVDRLGLVPFAASRAGGSYRAGSLFRVLSFVRMWDSAGINWVRIVKEFQDLIADDVKAIEGMTLDVGQSDVVRILNLHQAKGLEADVVFLVDSSDRERSATPNDAHLSRVDGEPTLSLPIAQSFGHSRRIVGTPPGWADDDAEEGRYQVAEQARLTYVAATRAKRLLVVGHYQGSGRTKYIWDELVTGLAVVPELKTPAMPPTEEPLDEPVPLAVLALERERAVEAAREPQYRISAVARHDSFGSSTDVYNDDGDAVVTTGYTRGGRGIEFGSIVHRLFEDLIQHRLVDVEASCDARFAIYEGSDRVTEEAKAAAIHAVDALRKSELFEAVNRSSEYYTEVPFGGLEHSPTAVEPDQLISGVIDLVYRTTDGWRIVDYKTDGVQDEKDVHTLVARYADQVRTYAVWWASITGEPVTSGALWLVSTAELIEINLDAGELKV